MNNLVNEIMMQLDNIEYGFKDKNGFNVFYDESKWDSEFDNFYYLQTPEELIKSKCGVCWDQVELERYLFNKNNIFCDTYFIYISDKDNLPSHTFLIYSEDNNYYWFEHSWNKYKGIHKYASLLSLLKDVKSKFISDYRGLNSYNTFVYKYDKPKDHIKCMEFYEYIDSCELIKLNDPLYFYHLVPKDADLRKGLLSLQYMYNHKLYDLFDKYTSKYIKRITNDWNISKYKGKDNLTREEVMDGLKIFRGEYGCEYIYFFKYPPYKELGPNMDNVLKYKDIYRININDEEFIKNIKDIFWGYDKSNSDNKILDKKYYENILESDYFKEYDDNLPMIFSTLNHISIAFKDGYCDSKFIEKM